MRARPAVAAVIVAAFAWPTAADRTLLPATAVSMWSASPALLPIAHGAAKSGGLLAGLETAAARGALPRISDVQRRG